MGSKGKKSGKGDASSPKAAPSSGESAAPKSSRMKTKEYDELLKPLHGELVALQEWVKATGAKVCIVFEGRDTAGKGGTIKAITERVSPRVFRVVALPAPTEREKSQMYIQRYLAHFPAAGEVVIFDRSWYNRAGVERVMGFCTPEQTERFLLLAPVHREGDGPLRDHPDQVLARGRPGGADPSARGRIDDPRKTWKLTDMDLKSYVKWDEYTVARDAMLEATSSPWAPWNVVYTDDQKRGRLNVVAHLLSQVPYEPQKIPTVTLPKRHVSDARPTLDLTQLAIPTRF